MSSSSSRISKAHDGARFRKAPREPGEAARRWGARAQGWDVGRERLGSLACRAHELGELDLDVASEDPRRTPERDDGEQDARAAAAQEQLEPPLAEMHLGAWRTAEDAERRVRQGRDAGDQRALRLPGRDVDPVDLDGEGIDDTR